MPIPFSWVWWAAWIPPGPILREYLNRFSKDPLWRGIRYARVWQMDNGKQVLKPGMAEGLKLLAQAGQTLDMANPSFDLLRGALLAMDAAPELRVVMDHMPSLDPTPETESLYDALLAELAQRPNFFVKLSQVRAQGCRANTVTAPQGTAGPADGGAWVKTASCSAATGPTASAPRLFPEAVTLMRDYFADRPRIQAEKYFWRNSQRIYRWKKRNASQPG